MIINNFWTICIVINLIVFAVVWKLSDEDKIFNSVFFVFVFFVIELFICCITYFCVNYSATEKYTDRTELIALNDYTDNKEILSGHYFLILGQINGEKSNTYNLRYAYKDNDGVIRIKSKDMNMSKIGFMDDDLREMDIIHERSYCKLNSVGAFLFKEPMTFFDTDCEVDYVFHIPKDSIIRDINIDLK